MEKPELTLNENMWVTSVIEMTVLGATAYRYSCSCGHVEPKYIDSRSANLKRLKKHAAKHTEE